MALKKSFFFKEKDEIVLKIEKYSEKAVIVKSLCLNHQLPPYRKNRETIKPAYNKS